MQAICDYLTVNLNVSYHNTPPVAYWLVSTSSQIRTGLVVEYFDRFPLFGSKQNDYQDFRTVFFMIKNREHLTLEGRTAIREIKRGMNNSRIFYSWSHLSNFYLS